jgi:hypothetical protein
MTKNDTKKRFKTTKSMFGVDPWLNTKDLRDEEENVK